MSAVVDPGALYDEIMSALKARPIRNLSTSAGFRQAYADTREALEPLGVRLTDSQVHALHWRDDLATLWDQAEFTLERHVGRLGFRVIWPRRGEAIRLEAKPKRRKA